NNKSKIAYQARRVLAQDASLLQRFHHQRNMSLLQITNTAVYQLCAPAGSSFAKVASLQQQHVVSAGRCVNRNTSPGCATANDNDVPRHMAVAPPMNHFRTVH